MWNKQKVSVIFSTYNEKGSIRQSIENFFSSGYVDEIIVINNNAVEGTYEEVKKTKAKHIYEPKQGYGWGYRRGMDEATGDILILSEPDGTFLGKDVIKLLAYSTEFDVVFGTRTTEALIEKGANMGFFMKWGNWGLAKIIQFSFNTSSLTDVGCTMRLLKRRAFEKIRSKFKVVTSHFGPEIILLSALNKIKFVEIPVNYKRRVGKSLVTGNAFKAFKLGIVMFFFIMKTRLLSIFFPNEYISKKIR